MGWGAICSQQRIRGPWSAEESKMHINFLELLAATFAVKTFVKKLIGRVLSQAQTQNAHLVLWHQCGSLSHGTQSFWECWWTSTIKGLSGNDQPRSINPNTATGRVTYLQDRYRSHQLSEEAVELMLNSWRTKTTSLTTHSLGNGIAGVINKVLTPFQDL